MVINVFNCFETETLELNWPLSQMRFTLANIFSLEQLLELGSLPSLTVVCALTCRRRHPGSTAQMQNFSVKGLAIQWGWPSGEWRGGTPDPSKEMLEDAVQKAWLRTWQDFAVTSQLICLRERHILFSLCFLQRRCLHGIVKVQMLEKGIECLHSYGSISKYLHNLLII